MRNVRRALYWIKSTKRNQSAKIGDPHQFTGWRGCYPRGSRLRRLRQAPCASICFTALSLPPPRPFLSTKIILVVLTLLDPRHFPCIPQNVMSNDKVRNNLSRLLTLEHTNVLLRFFIYLQHRYHITDLDADETRLRWYCVEYLAAYSERLQTRTKQP